MLTSEGKKNQNQQGNTDVSVTEPHVPKLLKDAD